ncbi:MAG TPA: 3-hydroxyacyl-CoA dehydrogenase NAD-binding domain-containing protein [Pseudoduganella sp.]|jgi:3-hydroxyacyl-CoA dehydrogenase/enoyl-CoA hydratase/3-hydroxybutyryl-CoA epimerase
MTNLKFDIDADGVALISIDLPDRPVNVFTPALTADLAAAVERVIATPGIKGAVLTSAKAGFIAGADLKNLVTAFDEGATLAQAAGRFAAENALMRRMETGGKPFAAAINGLALGGGLELALACHYRVLSDDPKASVGLPEVTVGLLPAGGGTQRLPRLIGIEKALPLLTQGTSLAPAAALKLGVVDALAPAAGVVAAARAWVLAHPQAQQPWDVKGFRTPGGAGCMAPFAVKSFQYGTTLARRGGFGNQPAALAILSAVFEGTQLPIDKALAVEAKYFARLFTSPVARNLIRTMFLNKGAADKLARRPEGIAKTRVAKLGVLGAGMMGAGIAFTAASAGIDVVLLDASQEGADKGKAYSSAVLEKDIARGRATREKADAVLARIHPTTAYADLAGCELVVEAVFENRAVKAEVTAQAEEFLAPSAVFASNTSTLMITGLAEKSRRPANFIGMHFFSPVERMPLVEIIRGARTSQETLARALDLCGQLRKTPIVVNDGPSFFTTRVYCTYVDEGMQMLADGVEPALIENAARMAGMPVGPLAVVDETTTDLRWKVIQQAEADGLGERYTRPPGHAVCKAMVEQGRGGRRFGGGFYDYPAGARKQLWQGLRQAFPPGAEQPEAEALKRRFLAIQALEAARCLEEGVLTHAEDGDLGSVLGVGYPAWTGGALSYIDTVGIGAFVAECERLAQAHGPRYQPTEWLRQRAAANQPMVGNPA